MNNLILRTLAGMPLLAASAAGMAATMDITASFTPSMDKPENNTFTNMTPQSGYCADYPSECKNNNTFSINMGESQLLWQHRDLQLIQKAEWVCISKCQGVARC